MAGGIDPTSVLARVLTELGVERLEQVTAVALAMQVVGDRIGAIDTRLKMILSPLVKDADRTTFLRAMARDILAHAERLERLH